jgi:hypothetical protein
MRHWLPALVLGALALVATGCSDDEDCSGEQQKVCRWNDATQAYDRDCHMVCMASYRCPSGTVPRPQCVWNPSCNNGAYYCEERPAPACGDGGIDDAGKTATTTYYSNDPRCATDR